MPASGSLVGMGLLIDYFVAASDDDARTVLDHGLGGRFASTDGSGVEPTAALGQFEELLTGRTFDEQLGDPASYEVIASSEDNEVAVIRLEPGFVQVLADADPPTLDRLALPWSKIEEFGGMADAADAADFLHRLRGLAQTAVPGNAGMYCRISL